MTTNEKDTFMPIPSGTQNLYDISYPLTPLQQGMVYHSLISPQSGIYIQQLIGHLQEDIDVPCLKEAWQRTVAHHAVLKTRFAQNTKGELFQYIAKGHELEWDIEDWSLLDYSDHEIHWKSHLKKDRNRGFALFETPLMRMTLVKLSMGNYRFLWTYHHALLDGRSQFRILNDFFGFYDSITTGRHYNPDSSPAFNDYINWLMQQDKEKAKNFWQKSLEGFEAANQLPLSLISWNPGVNGSERGSCEVLLTEETTLNLESFALSIDVTIGTLLQASWAALIARYAGEEDVVFGTTRACRHLPVKGVESMVGLLINTVPFRIQVDPDKPLCEWLKTIRSKWVVIRPYETTSLADIQAWSGFGPNKPLFDSIFVYENFSFNNVLRDKWGIQKHREFELLEKGTHTLVALGYGGSRLKLKLAYDRIRYDDDSAAQMLCHWKTLLMSMLKNSTSRVSNLQLLTEDEQKTILFDWNDTSHDYPKHLCLHQLFEAQASKTPDNIAIYFDNETITYAELNTRSNELAHILCTLGVGPDKLVAVCLNRTPLLIIAVLTVLKAGGTYVPLDPSYPKEQLSYMLSASGASILVTQRDLLERLPENKIATFCVDAVGESRVSEIISSPQSGVVPKNLAYTIYTSGSTGKPKLIGIEHRSVVNAIFYTINAVFTKEELKIVPFADSISFDASVYRIFSPLSIGGGIILLNSLFDLMNCPWANSITTIGGAPSVLKSLLKDFPLPESVKVVSVGGEVSDNELLEKVATCPQVEKIINFYGPTETTIYCMHSVLFKREKIPMEQISPQHKFNILKSSIIGRPIWNVRVYILDSKLMPVPPGVKGEICIGGECLARGYLNQPNLTSEKFIDDPSMKDTPARIYRTGDLGRFLPDRNIEFIGRIDNQVKIRGLRIEPEGVEAVLNSNPAVRESIVRAIDDMSGEKQLVAYIVPASIPDKNPDSDKNNGIFRDYLKEKLPRHMVPSIFVSLDKMPRNSTGKIDFNRLPKPVFDIWQQPQSFKEPDTELEWIIAQIWEEVLSKEKVGINDSLFDLGGDSLSATRIIARVNMTLGTELSLRAIFDAPTIAGCALAVEAWLYENSRLVE